MIARRAGALLLLMLLLIAVQPIAAALREQQPPVPEANRLGLGRLMGGVLTGAFRPLLLNYLWIRADILYGQGRADERQTLIRAMVALYPDNAGARQFLGWDLAFNQKNETKDPAVAWKWSQEGLEILLDAREADPLFTDPLVDWFLKQCGQNPLPPFHRMRYAGPEWKREKLLRAHLRRWANDRFGEPLDRFELGLRFNEGNDRFSGRVTRALLLERQVLDDWVREGRSDRVADAADALDWLSSDEGLGDRSHATRDYFALRARMLRELAEGVVSKGVLELGGYDSALALWVLGAHGRDLGLLQLAGVAFERFVEEPFPEERALVGRWIRYAEAGFEGDRPPLPFDS
jgi:hypothetical protein